MSKPAEYDQAVMDDLLAKPGVHAHVQQMKPEVLEAYIELLLQPQGHLPSIYEQHRQSLERRGELAR
ncbi:MAG: hypothetical protein KF698_08275 [Anaerolineales bacterium]|nr:hypothetical protein [Anaerolineales bacterium]